MGVSSLDKAVADATICLQNPAWCLHSMPARGGSVPHGEPVGPQVLLLGLAPGSTTSAAVSTDPALGPSPGAVMTRRWMWGEIIGCLCTCGSNVGSGTAVTSLVLGKSQQVTWSHLRGPELGLTWSQRGETAKVRVPSPAVRTQLVSKRCRWL